MHTAYNHAIQGAGTLRFPTKDLLQRSSLLEFSFEDEERPRVFLNASLAQLFRRKAADLGDQLRGILEGVLGVSDGSEGAASIPVFAGPPGDIHAETSHHQD